jgi:hypothetical protein
MRQAYLRGYLLAEPVDRGLCAVLAVRDVPSRRAITSLFVGAARHWRRFKPVQPFWLGPANLIS